jgi:hypothetical protein
MGNFNSPFYCSSAIFVWLFFTPINNQIDPFAAKIGYDCGLSMPFSREKTKKHAKVINNWTLLPTTHRNESAVAISPRKFLRPFLPLFNKRRMAESESFFAFASETVCAYAHCWRVFSSPQHVSLHFFFGFSKKNGAKSESPKRRSLFQ